MAIAPASLFDELRAVLGDRVTTSESVRDHHSHGESWHAAALPDAVAFPDSTAEVAAIVAACARARVPVIAFGMGSSLEGHVNAIRGGVSIDTTHRAGGSGRKCGKDRVDRILDPISRAPPADPAVVAAPHHRRRSRIRPLSSISPHGSQWRPSVAETSNHRARVRVPSDAGVCCPSVPASRRTR